MASQFYFDFLKKWKEEASRYSNWNQYPMWSYIHWLTIDFRSGIWISGISTADTMAVSMFYSTKNIIFKMIRLIDIHFLSLLKDYRHLNFVSSRFWTDMSSIEPWFIFSLASLLFWDNRQKKHQCFDPSMHRSNGRTMVQEAMAADPNIDDTEDITKLVVNRDGLRRIRSK